MGQIWGTNLRIHALQSNSDGSCSGKWEGSMGCWEAVGLSLPIISSFLRKVGSKDIWEGGRAWRFEEWEVQDGEGERAECGVQAGALELWAQWEGGTSCVSGFCLAFSLATFLLTGGGTGWELDFAWIVVWPNVSEEAREIQGHQACFQRDDDHSWPWSLLEKKDTETGPGR